MAKYDVATLEKKYKVTIPARARTFIETELKRYKGRTLARPLDGKLAEYDRVVFGSPSLFDANLFDRKQFPTKVPFAALADVRGSWRLELVFLECAGKAAGALELGRGYTTADGAPPKLKRIAATIDAFLKTLR